jgi:DNA-binding transcriptional LysR family regulator
MAESAPMMHGRMLRYLDELARSGSIRKASAHLNVASSAINRQLLSLEDELGILIFERHARGLRLTAAGELVLAHVRETLREHDKLRTRLNAVKGLQSGEVHIAAASNIVGGVLGGLIESLRQQHPQVRLKLRAEPADVAIALVLSGEVDLAFTTSDQAHARLREIASIQSHLCAAMAPDHPLAHRAMVRLTECLRFSLLLTMKGTPERSVVENYLPPQFTLSPALETNSIEAIKRLIRSSDGITFFSPIDLAGELQRCDVVCVPVFEFQNSPQRMRLVTRDTEPLDDISQLVAQSSRHYMDGYELPKISLRSPARAL